MKVIYYWTQRPINTNRTSSGYWRKYKFSEDLPKKKKSYFNQYVEDVK